MDIWIVLNVSIYIYFMYIQICEVFAVYIYIYIYTRPKITYLCISHKYEQHMQFEDARLPFVKVHNALASPEVFQPSLPGGSS